MIEADDTGEVVMKEDLELIHDEEAGPHDVSVRL